MWRKGLVTVVLVFSIDIFFLAQLFFFTTSNTLQCILLNFLVNLTGNRKINYLNLSLLVAFSVHGWAKCNLWFYSQWSEESLLFRKNTNLWLCSFLCLRHRPDSNQGPSHIFMFVSLFLVSPGIIAKDHSRNTLIWHYSLILQQYHTWNQNMWKTNLLRIIDRVKIQLSTDLIPLHRLFGNLSGTSNIFVLFDRN